MVPGHFLSLLTPDAKYPAPACRAEAGNGGPTPKPSGPGNCWAAQHIRPAGGHTVKATISKLHHASHPTEN